MDDRSLTHLCQIARLPKPSRITFLPEHWSTAKASRAGGLRHFQLHGNPATATGRSLGGRNSQRLFHAQPDYYRALGVIVRKVVRQPPLSAALAEFIGIVLGDGSIRVGQVVVWCNLLDIAYAQYLKRLIFNLFSVKASLSVDLRDHVVAVLASSVALVEHLETLGLKRGDKVRQQVDVPSWVWQRRDFQMACLRGLMDTDGCVYRHAYRVNGKLYGYTKLAFTNYSRPLLDSTKRLFEALGFFPTLHKDGRRLYLHDTQAVQRYFASVGTNNPRYRKRYLVTH
jgi:hypothetical protein